MDKPEKLLFIIGAVVVVIFGAPIVGGFLAGIADMVLGDLLTGTILGPHHPRTAQAWTLIGVAAMYAAWRRYK